MNDTFTQLATLPLVRLAVRTADTLRLRRIAPDGAFDESEADVLVLDLLDGEKPPADTALFIGALLVLSDDRTLAADLSIPGVLPRTASAGQIAAATAAVAQGLTVRLPSPPESGSLTLREAARPLLTPREMEVLSHIAEGLSNKSIARCLGISAHTVKYHLEAVFTKLAVRSRAEAVTRGLRAGLLEV